MTLKPGTFLIVLEDLSLYAYKSISEMRCKGRVEVKINDIILFQKFIDVGSFQYIEIVNSNCETAFIKWAVISLKEDDKLDEYFIPL